MKKIISQAVFDLSVVRKKYTLYREERMDTLLRAKEVANKLCISKSYAHRLMKTGEITTVRMGKAVRCRPEDLEKFILANLHTNEYIGKQTTIMDEHQPVHSGGNL